MKIKKVFIILGLIFSIFLFTGCGEDKSIKVELVIGDYNEIVELERNSSIDTRKVDFLANSFISGLYYDVGYKNEYKNDKLEKNTTLFIKVKSDVYFDLDKPLLDKIREDYCKKYEISGDTNLGSIVVELYVGTFNGFVISKLTAKNQPYQDVVVKEQIGDFIFEYPNPNKLLAWKNSNFYDLKELYENGDLEDEDIEKIHNNYNHIRIKMMLE